MKELKVSKLLVKRLQLYLDHLKSQPDTLTYASAPAIAKALDLGEVLVRKDLARVSSGGRCKTGHLRRQLIRDIEYFLHFGDMTHGIVVGAGGLGQALLSYPGFETAGLELLAGFDIHADRTCAANEKPIYPIGQMESFCEKNRILIGIITVPEEAAQEVCDRLVSCGIQAIWNFAPIRLHMPEHIIVRNENWANSVIELRLQMK